MTILLSVGHFVTGWEKFVSFQFLNQSINLFFSLLYPSRSVHNFILCSIFFLPSLWIFPGIFFLMFFLRFEKIVKCNFRNWFLPYLVSGDMVGILLSSSSSTILFLEAWVNHFRDCQCSFNRVTCHIQNRSREWSKSLTLKIFQCFLYLKQIIEWFWKWFSYILKRRRLAEIK